MSEKGPNFKKMFSQFTNLLMTAIKDRENSKEWVNPKAKDKREIALMLTKVPVFALSGKLDTLISWIYRAQAQLVYESRASHWGSPSIFNK